MTDVTLETLHLAVQELLKRVEALEQNVNRTEILAKQAVNRGHGVVSDGPP